MITAPLAALRSSLEAVAGQSLADVPESELAYFAAADGPFTVADWDQMPALFRHLGDRPCGCPSCRGNAW